MGTTTRYCGLIFADFWVFGWVQRPFSANCRKPSAICRPPCLKGAVCNADWGGYNLESLHHLRWSPLSLGEGGF